MNGTHTEIAPAQHPAEVLVLDVPGGEDGLLVEVVVGDVPEVEEADEDHRQR